MVRGKKVGLGEFLGDQAAAYIPGAALPSGPRIRCVYPRVPLESLMEGGRTHSCVSG